MTKKYAKSQFRELKSGNGIGKIKGATLLSAFKTLRYLHTSIKDKMVSIAVEKFTEVTSTVKQIIEVYPSLKLQSSTSPKSKQKIETISGFICPL